MSFEASYDLSLLSPCKEKQSPVYEVSQGTERPEGFPLRLPPATKVNLPQGSNWQMSLHALF